MGLHRSKGLLRLKYANYDSRERPQGVFQYEKHEIIFRIGGVGVGNR
jgi:hypothetical protein